MLEHTQELAMKKHQALALIAVLVFGVSLWAATQSFRDSGDKMTQIDSTVSGLHDFDFLVGRWHVHHRRLREMLTDKREWVEFEGTSVVQKVLGGYGITDDNVIEFPDGPYRGASLKAFDAQSGRWSIWWLDSRSPLGPLDPPVRGGFQDGTGTFFADEIFKGKPIRVRFTWSGITPTTCHWEQAFSTDGGATWETNWLMDFTRAA
jgi:uncharacterized protein DUF1579